jgi:hypothetical protein
MDRAQHDVQLMTEIVIRLLVEWSNMQSKRIMNKQIERCPDCAGQRSPYPVIADVADNGLQTW